MRHMTRILAALLVFSALASSLNCASGEVTTKQEGSACCRAMRFACHKSQAPSACCTGEASTRTPIAVPLPAKKVSSPPLLIAATFLLTSTVSTITDQAVIHSRILREGHSPPGNVRIFLLHSALLI